MFRPAFRLVQFATDSKLLPVRQPEVAQSQIRLGLPCHQFSFLPGFVLCRTRHHAGSPRPGRSQRSFQSL